MAPDVHEDLAAAPDVEVVSGTETGTTTKKVAKTVHNDSIPDTSTMGMGGRLTHYLVTWIAHGLGDWLMDMLLNGYRLPFEEHPPLTRNPSVLSGYYNAEKNLALRLVIQELLTKMQ